MLDRVDPFQFYDLVKIAEEVKPSSDLNKWIAILNEKIDILDQQSSFLSSAYNAMLAEARRTSRMISDQNTEEKNEWKWKFEHVTSGANFVSLILQYTMSFHSYYKELRSVMESLRPMTFLFLGEDRKFPASSKEVQEFVAIVDLNSDKLSKFINNVSIAYTLPRTVVDLVKNIVHVQENYYKTLANRHSVRGIKIYRNPILTDLAMCLYENIDGHGEIAEGKKADEVSAYSIRKATLLADTLTSEVLKTYIESPDELTSFLTQQIRTLWGIAREVSQAVREPAERVRQLLRRGPLPRLPSRTEFEDALLCLTDLNPLNIQEADKTGLLTTEEKLAREFENETLAVLADMLGRATGSEIVQYVLGRKEEWYAKNRDVNSFYVCRIGSGNYFVGEAPGVLEVVPGVKPRVNLDEIVGSGFDEVRAMIEHAKNSSKWADLFMATSPSKKVDKMNVLLVGPMGCGKTEALRALGSDPKSIGIFAQASDFLTCWKGEAEKNPKRLFEAGLKLQKESGRQVFFLIDEIDTILNGDRGQAAFGGTNLATEFQVLMDGITSYPNLAVWGATNHPERIPMPLIRRFAKVLVVGELTQKDRVTLLKRFVSYLPLSEGFNDEVWEDAAKMLDGAVGDTVRKVTDHIWRSKMFGFVTKNPDKAEEMVKYLQRDGTRFDPAKATPEWRSRFHQVLRPYVQVRPGDILEAVQLYLDNPAIRQEIQTAVDTYKASRNYLVGMVASKI